MRHKRTRSPCAVACAGGWRELVRLTVAALREVSPAGVSLTPRGMQLMLASDTEPATRRRAARAARIPASDDVVGHVQTDPGDGGASERTAGPHRPSRYVDAEHAETWRLVTRAQSGDGEAFGQLYDRYVDVVHRYVYFRVNDRGLAEDFTSETFLRALRRIGSITYQGRDIGAWLITIARNIVFDHMKSARRRLEVTTGDVLDGDVSAPSPETAALESFTSARLMTAVAQLTEDQCECVTLRFVHGFSVAETASAMGRNDGAIKALQHRAVKRLAELVGDELR